MRTGSHPVATCGSSVSSGACCSSPNRNALHDPRLPFVEFEQPSPEVGLRLAYLPLPYLGAEGEFMGAASVLQGGEGAILWARAADISCFRSPRGG